jgi:hypothetical protein
MSTRKEQLAFCTICEHRQMDFKKGLLCGLTRSHATFDKSCNEFVEDEAEKIHRLVRDLDASGHQSAAKSLDASKNKENGLLIAVIGVIVVFISLSFMRLSGFIILPVGIILYGLRTFFKGLEQEKVYKRFEDFENKKDHNY